MSNEISEEMSGIVDIEITDNRRQNLRVRSAEHFWDRVQKPVGCWLFNGAKETNGYGYLKNPFGAPPQYLTAHRVAWILTHGPIPEGMKVLHRCDIRACVNPEHLFLGTDADNEADKQAKDRHSRGIRSHSAKLNDEKVREMRRLHKAGVRICVLARQFGVAHCTATLACSGRTWKHIP